MRLISIEIRRVELDLVEAVETANDYHAKRPLVLVHVETDVGPGDGECDALETTRYAGESADTVEESLVSRIVPPLVALDNDFEFAEGVLAVVDETDPSPMARAGLEMALLDAELRAAGRSLGSFLGVSRTEIAAGATIGIGTVAAIVASTRTAADRGIRRIKLKVSPEVDVATVRAVLEELPHITFVVDANASYSIEEPIHRAALLELDELGLAAIEQPLAPRDFEGHARLSAELVTPIVLDESIASLNDVDKAISRRACAAVSVKLSRLGGILAARETRDRCREGEIGCAIGGMFEAGLGRAAAIAVGALDGFDFPGDLGPSDRYFATDVTDPHELVAGNLVVPTGPGLGVNLRHDVVEALTTRSQLIRRP